MATDLAEFIGAAIGLNLLFGIPLFPAALITGVAAFAILGLQARGFRHAGGGDRGVRRRDRRRVRARRCSSPTRSRTDVAHGLRPAASTGTESVLLAVGILGATVMPHVIYLHSALTQHRIVGATTTSKRRIFRFEMVDVVHRDGDRRARQHEHADHRRGGVPRARPDRRRRRPRRRSATSSATSSAATRALLFGVALLASGLSLVERRHDGRPGRDAGLHPASDPALPPPRGHDGAGARDHRARRRPVTALVLSQVVLSFGIPFALIPLLLFCRDRDADGRARQPPLDDGVAAAS